MTILRARWCGLVAGLMLAAGASGGCSQLVTEGHVSDRETGSPIPNVEILRAESNGEWSELGRTDPGGAYFIFKSKFGGEGQIRLRKPGYYSETMRGSEFLGSSSHVMIPTGRTPDREESAAEGADKSDPFR